MDFRASLFSGICYKRFGFSKNRSGGWCGSGSQCRENVHAGTGRGLVMDETDHDAQWEHFINDQGRTVEKEIYNALQEDAHLFDTMDGTHAKWSEDGLLGLLLVFSEDDAEMLLAAFHASLEGVDDATHAWGVWITSLMGMIRQCMSGVPEDN